MAAKIPLDDPDNIVQTYLAGESAKSIARRLDVSYPVIRRALIRAGVVMRDSRATMRPLPVQGQEEGICEAFLLGASVKSISATYGCSRGAIDSVLREAGIAGRAPQESIALAYSQIDPDERKRIASAAQNARRGKSNTTEHKAKIAATREAKQLGVSPYEMLIGEWLKQRGIIATPQKAVGIYNIDLAFETVAVEVFGGAWHNSGRHAARAPERFRYILNAGWNIVIIWVDQARYPLSVATADYIAAFAETARRDPSMRGQYRVIWSDGKEAAASRLNIDNLTLEPPRN